VHRVVLPFAQIYDYSIDVNIYRIYTVHKPNKYWYECFFQISQCS